MIRGPKLQERTADRAGQQHPRSVTCYLLSTAHTPADLRAGRLIFLLAVSRTPNGLIWVVRWLSATWRCLAEVAPGSTASSLLGGGSIEASGPCRSGSLKGNRISGDRRMPLGEENDGIRDGHCGL